MTDLSIVGRIGSVITELRSAAALHEDHGDRYVIAYDTARSFADDLDKISDDLLALSGDMRGQSEARMEDTSVEAKGFLSEAMDQYADRIDTQPAPINTRTGTSAHQLLADAEKINVEVTETLIQMVVATVLAKLIDEEGGGRASITISPADMDSMYQRYRMEASNDGLITAVKIVPREHVMPDAEVITATPASFYAESGIDATPAKPQAPEHVYDRPLWAVRIDGVLTPCSDRDAAKRSVPWYEINRTQNIVQVENRFCYHDDCPAERCNHNETSAEVTSD